jgi:peptidyl-prolyl cis-trans isomerase SurA
MNMIKALLSSFLLLSLLWTASPRAFAQEALRAAAVVNDQIISILDLSERLRLVIVSAGLQDTPETRRRIAPSVLRQLIDESLKLQEAKRLDITVTPEQIQAAIQDVAQRNGMNSVSFHEYLTERGVSPRAFQWQLETSLIWSEVLSRRFRPEIVISDDEVGEVIERRRRAEGQDQFRFSEIYVAFNSPADEANAKGVAERLLEQVRSGAKFDQVARQFSQSATARLGGDRGWFMEEDLPPELEGPAKTMEPGQVAGPIRTLGGFYLIQLTNRGKVHSAVGEERLRLSRLNFPIEDGDEEAAREAANAATSEVKSCAQADTLAEELGTDGSGSMGLVLLKDLPTTVQSAVTSLPVGKPSQPVAVDGDLTVFVVCLREGGIDRERIRASLEREKLDLLGRRYMRDLRRSANVDIRV